MKNVFIMDHPLIKHKIGLIRRKRRSRARSSRSFRS